ncbi:hypothetical protein XENOCAPTIV_025438, partial [Xenoophorus captivus]
CEEALKLFVPGSSQRCPILDMIEFLPESCKHLLDRCVRESDDDHNSPDYHIEYDFRWLQTPISAKLIEQGYSPPPLAAVNVSFPLSNLTFVYSDASASHEAQFILFLRVS